MNRFVPQPGPPRGAGDNPYSDYVAPQAGLIPNAERPTPEQEAERDKFDECKGLLDSIFSKAPNVVISSHEARPLPTEAGQTSSEQWTREEYHKAGQKIEGDEPHNLTGRSMDFPIDHPTYSQLRAFEQDMRKFLITPSNMPGIKMTPVVQIYLLRRGTEAPTAQYVTCSLLQSGEVIMRDAQLDDPDVIDHEQKMAKLDEMYDVLSFVTADLPDKPKDDDTSEAENEVE